MADGESVSPMLAAARAAADAALERFLAVSRGTPSPAELSAAIDALSEARVRVSRIEDFLAVFDGDHSIISAEDVGAAVDHIDAILAAAVNDLRIALGL